uniref:NADH dehydrogenase subunit 6 n=1 Tax=Oxycarenus lugubris TaxID=2813423 RepID=A0A8T9ZZM9_9HEMI|nr:NADH dehydrogenase subunit 6 [Oxycarenus lugubris]
MILLTIMILSLIFMWLNHPISMAILIIMMTILMALLTGIMLNTFWFSYIVIIIMLSGMLVLFIYMASIASNEKFKLSMSLIIFTPLFSIILWVSNKNLDLMTSSEAPINVYLNYLFNSPTMYLTMIMVIYLLLSMITVSKIVHIYEGPLRIKK